MGEEAYELNTRTMSDQWVTDRYCKELVKAKAATHFQGKINLGQADCSPSQLPCQFLIKGAN